MKKECAGIVQVHRRESVYNNRKYSFPFRLHTAFPHISHNALHIYEM